MKMNKPKPPVCPVEPKKPEKETRVTKDISLSDHEGKSLAEVLEIEFPGVSLADLHIRELEGWCEYTYYALCHDTLEPNPKYEKQLRRYEVNMLDYKEKMDKYKESLTKYEEALREYQVWEIDKLQKELREKIRKLEA